MKPGGNKTHYHQQKDVLLEDRNGLSDECLLQTTLWTIKIQLRQLNSLNCRSHSRFISLLFYQIQFEKLNYCMSQMLAEKKSSREHYILYTMY